MARRLRRVLATTAKGGLLKVSVVQGNDTIKFTKKKDIEVACHEENGLKFCQTNSSLAMKKLLCNILSFLGMSPAC